MMRKTNVKVGQENENQRERDKEEKERFAHLIWIQCDLLIASLGTCSLKDSIVQNRIIL